MLPAAMPKRYVVKPKRDIVELGTPSSSVMPCGAEMPEVYADEYNTLCSVSTNHEHGLGKLTPYNSQSYKRR